LAVNGAQGVRDVITILRCELEQTLILCGIQSLLELNEDFLFMG
jgi:isopentenyl diphosphate isomerase/L-lactate dehydrogenase-like FMN-dependent dehydrogenase